MRSAGIRALGGPIERLEVPAPPLPTGEEVLIEVRTAGIGNWDDLVRTGVWDVGAEPPMALGVEAAGVVSAIGATQTRFAPGDEVLAHSVPLRHQGAWAEWFLAPGLSIRYTERLAEADAVSSVGSRGDSYDCETLGASRAA